MFRIANWVTNIQLIQYVRIACSLATKYGRVASPVERSSCYLFFKLQPSRWTSHTSPDGHIRRADMTADQVIQILYLVAITVESMTAAISAGRRKMDWLGVCVLGSVTALGGGSMRDLLLDHHPLSWVRQPSLLFVTTGAALATIALAKLMPKLRHLFLFLDAIGLVVFTIIGCRIAESLDLPLMVVIASGVITGCVGGVLRDILCAEVPLLFRAELYATVSVLAALTYLGSLAVGMSEGIALLLATIAGISLRLTAIRYHWSLPKFIYGDID